MEKKNNGLSPKQATALEGIKAFIQDKGYSPSTRELAKQLGYKSSSTVHELLDKLEAKGFISKGVGGPRTIRLLKENEPSVDELKKEIEALHEIVESQETVRLRNFELAKELEVVMKEGDKLKEALDFYADGENWRQKCQPVGRVSIRSKMDDDYGRVARRALGLEEE